MNIDRAHVTDLNQMKYVLNLDAINANDIDKVGGKNASLGEMIQNLTRAGIKVPGGFATTVAAYRAFLVFNKLDEKISNRLTGLDVENVRQLNKVSQEVRRWISDADFFPELETEILEAYNAIGRQNVAVRSSATAEDLPSASFAGQQETFLNIKGNQNVLNAIKMVYASLFTSRAIAYRDHHGFDFKQIGISAGIQPMVRSDKGASGVMFTLDTESGFDQVVLITAAYGLGEAVVQGSVNPDEFVVYKRALAEEKMPILQRKLGSKAMKTVYTQSHNPNDSIKVVPVSKSEQVRFCINDQDVLTLAKQALLVEEHYGRPMDIEWAKDGNTGEIYILQARPETVRSQKSQANVIEQYKLQTRGSILVEGQSIGQQIGSGKARIISDPSKMNSVKEGEIIVTDMTDPDWEPIMKRSAAIVTNRGGRTCHAAIVARELGIPAVVGCGDATERVKDNTPVTVSCAEGQVGYVYDGELDFEVNQIAIGEMPKLPLNICINMGNPDMAFATQQLPNGGVGLARLEFIISNKIGVHPNACLEYSTLPKRIKDKVSAKVSAYPDPREYYIEKLREGISMIAAAFYPKPVIFRLSDFKTNEYENLIGGEIYEPREENPMLGFRGASRYVDERFRDAFAMECEAFQRVREGMGLNNCKIMIPFVRTVDELLNVLGAMSEHGLNRGENNLEVYMMCEIPSNAVLADEFLEHVDGYSIGSNDLTQLVLGLDRDSSIVASLFDERNDAVKALLEKAITACNEKDKYIGICGQAPSDYPEFAEWLMDKGIKNISLNPDSILSTWLSLAEYKKKAEKSQASL